MNEEVNLYLDDAKESMDNAINHLKGDLSKLRAGKASPAVLDGLMVEYYGAMTPLSQVCNVNTPDARTILITPWEKAMINPIETAIMKANLGFNPSNDAIVIRINVPPLTEERRKDLVKKVKMDAENTKVSIRNVRRDVNAGIKDLLKDGLAEDLAKDAEVSVQDLTNKYIAKVDELVNEKEKDIMTI